MKNRHLEGGEFFEHLHKQKIMPYDIAADIMRQILSAVVYCHNQGIVHRDLKPKNIMIDNKSEKGKVTIKLIDFGMATWFKQEEKLSKLMGTICFIAPEVLERKYNEKCDVWSCGVILYLLLSGTLPFFGQTEEEVLKSIKKGKFAFSGILYFFMFFIRPYMEICSY